MSERDPLKLCFILFDLKRGLLENDLNLLDWLAHTKLSVVLIATKVDKLNQKEKSAKLKKARKITDPMEVIVTSSHKKQGLDKLIEIMRFESD